MEFDVEETLKETEERDSTLTQTARLSPTCAVPPEGTLLLLLTELIHKIRQLGSLKVGDLSEVGRKKLKNALSKLAVGLLNQLEEATSMKKIYEVLFVIIACAIMAESNFYPSILTLFSTLYDVMVDKNSYKTKEITEKHNMLSISHCGGFNLEGIDQKYDFQCEDLADIKEVLLQISLLVNKYTTERVTYRFFDKSFQEYTAGRKLYKLLTSVQEAEVKKESDLHKVNTISAIEYFSLLLYTCGSSIDDTTVILDLIRRTDHRDLSQLSSFKNLSLESEYTKKS
ncbi:LOW QUALITY PROTEIN: NLR family CARD domain-containing protein 4 [Phaethornis superciliosus]